MEALNWRPPRGSSNERIIVPLKGANTDQKTLKYRRAETLSETKLGLQKDVSVATRQNFVPKT